ncbi:MAG: ELM1/GtrOC1 family putative glycosyltransferase [Hyphomicrobiaceae bacterium]
MTPGTAKSNLQTLLISDGKPGHYHLTEGICAALARRRKLDIARIDVSRPRWLPARALSALTNTGSLGRRAVPKALGFDARPVGACDLIVSAGGDTLAANVALARAYGCPNIFYGSLRRYRAEDFTLVLTSYEANAHRLHHAMTLKPSAFDPDTMPVRAPGDPRPVTGLLIGGDSGTVRFAHEDWQQLLGLLTGSMAQTRWVVSNSRRTPDGLSGDILRLAEASGGAIRFVDVRREGAGTLAALFMASDQIAVTVDSSSMISEAIWARKPVVALLPRTALLPVLEQGYRDYLANHGWIAELPLEEASGERLNAACKAVRPLAVNPLDGLADLLTARLPTLLA